MQFLDTLNRVIKCSTGSFLKSPSKEEIRGPKIDRYEVTIPDFCKAEKIRREVAQEGLRVALENWRTGQNIRDFRLHFTGNLAIWILKE